MQRPNVLHVGNVTAVVKGEGCQMLLQFGIVHTRLQEFIVESVRPSHLELASSQGEKRADATSKKLNRDRRGRNNVEEAEGDQKRGGWVREEDQREKARSARLACCLAPPDTKGNRWCTCPTPL